MDLEADLEANVAPDRAAPDRAAPDRAATDRAATDRAATDRAATDRAATDRAATDRAATDRAAADRVVALVREHQAGLWRYLRFLGCAAAEAEDLAQETFLAVLRRPFVDQGRAATAGYLRTVARNLLRKQRRSARRAPASADVDVGDLSAVEDEAVWLQHAGDDGGEGMIAALRACLGELSGRARQGLTLQYEERRSRADIAMALQMSEDGVKSLVRRAREVLRRCIERKGREGW